jgi:hypothetical protein
MTKMKNTELSIEQQGEARYASGKYDKKLGGISDLKVSGRQPFIVYADIKGLIEKGIHPFEGKLANSTAYDIGTQQCPINYAAYWGFSSLFLEFGNILTEAQAADAFYYAAKNDQVYTMAIICEYLSPDFDKIEFSRMFRDIAKQNAIMWMIENLRVTEIVKHQSERERFANYDYQLGSMVKSLSDRGFFKELHTFMNTFDPYGVIASKAVTF